MALRRFLFLIPFFLLACGSGPETPVKKDSLYAPPVKIDSTRQGLVYPRQMDIVRMSAYDDFTVRIGDSIYHCSYKGIIESSDISGNETHFITDLKAEYLIDKVYLQPVGSNQFFVSWQETDHTGVSSYYALFDRGASKPVWLNSNKAPAPGPPAIDAANVYVSSLGMIAKFGLYSGETVWRYDSLFDPMKIRFKEFERPLIYTSTVCFYDKPVKGKKSNRDSIWVNDKSGELVR